MKISEPSLDSRIWQVVSAIPTGKVASYGDIATHAGLPGGARRVGAALRKLPEGTRLPWHRVINNRGQLSLPPGSVSGREQRNRLREEGIIFSKNRSVDMVKYRWRP